MAQGSQKVLGQVLKLIDLYDLYGSVAYPKVNISFSQRCPKYKYIIPEHAVQCAGTSAVAQQMLSCSID